jgi:hypothetical protein
MRPYLSDRPPAEVRPELLTDEGLERFARGTLERLARYSLLEA